MNIDDIKAIVSYHELRHQEQMKSADELLKYSKELRESNLKDL